jgi:hypothetical protein
MKIIIVGAAVEVGRGGARIEANDITVIDRCRSRRRLQDRLTCADWSATLHRYRRLWCLPANDGYVDRRHCRDNIWSPAGGGRPFNIRRASRACAVEPRQHQLIGEGLCATRDLSRRAVTDLLVISWKRQAGVRRPAS